MASNLFYYIQTVGYCQYGTYILNTTGHPGFANLCAWTPSLPNVVYACDSGNGVCWTGSTPVCDVERLTTDQLLCTGKGRNAAKRWCCRSGIEVCSTLESMPNICWADDQEAPNEDPMRSITPNVATQSASAVQILASKGVTISTPPVLAITMPTTASTIASTATNTTAMLTASPGSNNSNNTTIPTSLGGNSSDDQDGGELSNGVIAGIVVGIIAAVLAIPGAVVAVKKLRGPKRQTGEQQTE